MKKVIALLVLSAGLCLFTWTKTYGSGIKICEADPVPDDSDIPPFSERYPGFIWLKNPDTEMVKEVISVAGPIFYPKT